MHRNPSVPDRSPLPSFPAAGTGTAGDSGAHATQRHLLTVALEDYYQVGAFNRLLDEHGMRATFFVLGWVAEAVPELIAEVSARGHEVASKGFYHRSIHHLSPFSRH